MGGRRDIDVDDDLVTLPLRLQLSLRSAQSLQNVCFGFRPATTESSLELFEARRGDEYRERVLCLAFDLARPLYVDLENHVFALVEDGIYGIRGSPVEVVTVHPSPLQEPVVLDHTLELALREKKVVLTLSLAGAGRPRRS